MNLNAQYTMSPKAVIRPERFGGLVYRYDNRRLYFLHSHELVDFVNQLNEEESLSDQIDSYLAARNLSPKSRESFVKALTQLESLEVIHEL